MTISTAEAEYIRECHAVKEAMFLAQALKEVGYEKLNIKKIKLLADN